MRASGPRVERDGSFRLRARLFGIRSRRDVRLAPRFAALADERLSLGRERPGLERGGIERHPRSGQVLLQTVQPEVPADARRARSVLLEVLLADSALVSDVLERQPRLWTIGREPNV